MIVLQSHRRFFGVAVTLLATAALLLHPMMVVEATTTTSLSPSPSTKARFLVDIRTARHHHHRHHAKFRKNGVIFNNQLAVRGGDGGGGVDSLVNPKTAAKIFSIGYLIQGSLFHFLPEIQARWYGWDRDDVVSTSVTYGVETLGCLILMTGIGSYCMLFQESSVETALGALCIASCLSTIKFLVFNPKYAQLARTPTTYLLLAATAVGAYAGSTNRTWCTNYFKVLIPLLSLSAIQFAFFTESALTVWGIPEEERSKGLTRLAKGIGHFWFTLELHNWLLIMGWKPEMAIAYASISGLVHFIDSLFINGSALQGGKMSSTIGYGFWLVFFITDILSITLGSSSARKATTTTTTPPPTN